MVYRVGFGKVYWLLAAVEAAAGVKKAEQKRKSKFRNKSRKYRHKQTIEDPQSIIDITSHNVYFATLYCGYSMTIHSWPNRGVFHKYCD